MARPFQLGTSTFTDALFLVVVADRFFHVWERPDGTTSLDVIRWDPDAKLGTYEVRDGAPNDPAIRTNPTGIITFTSEERGFLFKFRPKPGVSAIFGAVPVDEEITVHVDDREVDVTRNGKSLAAFNNNSIDQAIIGIQVRADGTVGFGGGVLPDGMVVARDNTTGRVVIRDVDREYLRMPDPRVVGFIANKTAMELDVIEGRTFDNDTIYLDGREFRGCTFLNGCKLVLQIGRFAITDSGFGDTDLIVDGPAADIVQFVQNWPQVLGSPDPVH